MKKYNFIIMFMTIVIMIGLSACADKNKTLEDENVTVQLIDCSEVQTDASIDDYFQGDLPETVKKLEPLLVPAMSLYAKEGVTVFPGDSHDDAELKWQIVLAQISNYGNGKPVDAGGGNQNYIVTEDTIDKYFNNCFAGNTTGASEIPKIYADMYDENTGEYAVPAYLELPRTYGVLKHVSLSKGNSVKDDTVSAIMEYTLTTPLNGEPDIPFGEISIEIVKNPNSSYGYSLQSLSFMDIQ